MSNIIEQVIVPPQIHVSHTKTIKGLGVFARKTFEKGATVELCPVVIMPSNDVPAILSTRLFDWGLLASIRYVEVRALALGYGSLYNHANPANLIYSAEPAGPYLRFSAARAILENEELFINYNASDGSEFSARDSWFESHGLKAT